MNAKHVVSVDGTEIVYWQCGAGPALVLVHGGICDHMAWHAVVPLLARHFTVVTFDRRGRGESGDAPAHSVAREIEDIDSVLRTVGEPAVLVGHSAGAILSLAAAQSSRLRALVVYEPPFILEGTREHPDPALVAVMKDLLGQGRREDVLRLAMRESVGVSDTEFDQLRIGPGWKHLLGVAPAVPYDWKIWEERFDPQRLAALKIPVLVLLGSESPSWIRTSTEAVHGVIPGAMLSLLPGQEHFAMLTAPELFAQQVTSFALQHCQP